MTIQDPGQPARQPTPDDLRWEKEAGELAHTSLTTVQAKAAAWTTSISAVLGAFALAAFVKGPEALKDIPTTQKILGQDPKIGEFSVFNPALAVALLIFIAAGLLTWAIYIAAIAAQGVPTWSTYVDGPKLRQQTREKTKSAIAGIQRSRNRTLIAVWLVFIALAIAWSSQVLTSGGSKGQSAIVSTSLNVVCGKLVSGSAGALVVIPDGGSPTSIGTPATITLVDSCPPKQ